MVFAERSFKASRAAGGRNDLAVVWVVHVDPDGGVNPNKLCRNASLVKKSHVQGEEEYLFVPYSVFTVTSVEQGGADFASPMKIHIEAASDNIRESEDLPLAPWY